MRKLRFRTSKDETLAGIAKYPPSAVEIESGKIANAFSRKIYSFKGFPDCTVQSSIVSFASIL